MWQACHGGRRKSRRITRMMLSVRLSAAGNACVPWRDCRRRSSSTSAGCRPCCCPGTASHNPDWRIAVPARADRPTSRSAADHSTGASNAAAEGSGNPTSQPSGLTHWRAGAAASAALSAARSVSAGARPNAVAAKQRWIVSRSANAPSNRLTAGARRWVKPGGKRSAFAAQRSRSLGPSTRRSASACHASSGYWRRRDRDRHRAPGSTAPCRFGMVI